MLSKFFKNVQAQATDRSLRFTAWALKVLPRWFIVAIMEILFSIATLFTKRLNTICMRNLQAVYGESKDQKEYERLTKQCIKNIGYCMMDLLYYVDRPSRLSKIVKIEHEEHLKKALDLGCGVIAVSAHLSNFPLLFVSLVQKGYKVNVIIRKMRSEHFSKFMYHLCSKWNINMIQTTPRKQFLKETLNALKRNEILFILFDETVPKEEGVEVNFFNSQVTRAIGPMLFQERTNAPVLPIFIVKDEHKNFKIIIDEPLKVHEELNEEENIVKNISDLTNVIEKYVNIYPVQWGGWLNKRWIVDN